MANINQPAGDAKPTDAAKKHYACITNICIPHPDKTSGVPIMHLKPGARVSLSDADAKAALKQRAIELID